MDSQQIRVAILDNDNSAKFREQLVKLLKEEPDINLVAEADSGLAGIKVVEEQKPDVILIDSKQPFTEGLETTEMIVSKFQDTRIIFLSRDSSGTTMAASECLVGACLPLYQDCSTEEILATIREGYQPKNGSAPKSMGQPNSFNQKEKQSCSVSQNNPG